MRKKLIKWSVVVCMVAALLLFLRWKLPAKQDVSLAETSLAAADDLVASYRDGQNSLMFRSRDISEQEVYHLLQAGEPYLSNLETETYQNGALRLTWNIPSKQEQDDGLKAARKLGAQAVQGQITIAGKLQAIHDALIRGCVYTENGELRTQMAAGAVQDKKAVCAGYARAFQAMCDGADLDVYYVEDDDMTHAWNAVRLYGTTYFIDCTYDDPVPDGGEKVCQSYFMLTADEMKQTHTWNAELYEDYLDSRCPENFAYIQRMQDLQLADAGLRAGDCDKNASSGEIAQLNKLLDTTVADSEEKISRGELYKKGYQALSEEVDGEKRIERLINNYTVPMLVARKMGF